MEKVSILVPVYNVEKYISKCAISLFEQTYSNIEYVFVNDCTKDRSIDVINNILLNYPARQGQVKIIEHEKNKGVAAARNTAVNNATGEFLMYVDSDDYIENNMVETLVRNAIENKSDIAICDYFLSFKGREYYVNNYYTTDVNEFLKMLLIRKADPSLCCKLYKTSFYKGSGVFFIEGINYGEDYLVLVKLFSTAKMVTKVASPLYHYVKYNNTSSTNNITISSIENIVKINEIIYNMFNNIPGFKTIVNVSILRNKLGLIKMSRPSLYGLIIPLYCDVEKEYSRYLDFRDRVLIMLEKTRISFLIYLYCRLGVLLKSM